MSAWQLAKPATSDSEDDEPLAAIHSDRTTAAQRAAAEEAEIEAVRKRLAEADVTQGEAAREAHRAAVDDDWEGEIEKLQVKQRRGIHRHNSRRGGDGFSSSDHGAMQDLLDLDFDDTASSSGPSLRPHNRLSTSTGASGSGSGHSVRTAPSSQSQRVVSGTLSDFSDYDSSDEEGAAAHGGYQQHTNAAAAAAGLPNESGSSLHLASHGAALESYRRRAHRPRIGEETSSLWSKEDEERWIRGEEDEEQQLDGEDNEDPFGDEWEEVAGRLRASGAEAGREQYAVV